MINISKLLTPNPRRASFPGDSLRYARGGIAPPPVIVWHMTGRCNLACRHCYSASSASSARPARGGFDADERVMGRDDVAVFLRELGCLRVPALLMSGGEPMEHPDFFSCVSMALDQGLRITLSTNGTRIDRAAARRLAGAVAYAGVSLDGPEEVNDAFRGVRGAFRASLEAIGHLASNGVKVGLRVTLARPILRRLPDIFGLAENLPISRICFYHFIPSGRGALDASLAPSGEEDAGAVGAVIEWADAMRREAGGVGVGVKPPLEILTAGDASDGVRVYRYLAERGVERIADVEELLGLASSGAGILSVRWDGAVFPNQFAWDRPLGTWRELGEIADGVRRSGETAPECLTCAWRRRKICRGRPEPLGRRLGACSVHDRTGHDSGTA